MGYDCRFLGWDSLSECVTREWSTDIMSRQLPLILKGVGPTHYITQFGGLRAWLLEGEFLPRSLAFLLHFPSFPSLLFFPSFPFFSPPPSLSLLSHSVNGVVDLVRLPYHQYQEDGRIMWGLQQGASSFSTSTGVAVVELTSRTLETLQVHTIIHFLTYT